MQTVAVQKIGYLFHVRFIGSGRRHRVNQAAVGIDADMRLHAEVPLLALLRLMHVGVALALGILGRTRRRDDRGIDDAATFEKQALSARCALTAALEEPTRLSVRNSPTFFRMLVDAFTELPRRVLRLVLKNNYTRHRLMHVPVLPGPRHRVGKPSYK